jgi:hypothetical protein
MFLIRASDAPPDQKKHVNMDGPVKLLFTIQRTSKAFQAAISKCKLLQQRMFLSPYPAETPGLPLKAPVFWLQSCTEAAGTHQLLGCDYWRNDFIDAALRLRGKPLPELSACWLNQKASWRKMKILCQGEGVLDGISINFYFQCRFKICWRGTTPTELGPLYDGFEQMMLFQVRFEEQQRARGFGNALHDYERYIAKYRVPADQVEWWDRNAEWGRWKHDNQKRLIRELAGEFGLIVIEDDDASARGGSYQGFLEYIGVGLTDEDAIMSEASQ